jgi:hypothetical protein
MYRFHKSSPNEASTLCNFVYVHEIKACGRRVGGIAPVILNLGTRWRWVVSLTLRPLDIQWKTLPCPLNRRLCGLHIRSGRFWEGKSLLLLPIFEHRNFQRVWWSVYRLHCRAPFITAAKFCRLRILRTR